VQLIAIPILAIIAYLLFRSGVIVLDRKVFQFQIDPVLERGEIANLRDYKIVHNFIEMMFDRDPDLFEKCPKIRKLNGMMNRFHERTHNH
jgi:hypothetical protein